MPDLPLQKVDILIVGGGPVGSAVATGLDGSHLRIAVVGPTATSTDSRPIALSHGSRLILENIGAWPAPDATEISTIHVSHQGRFGRTRVEAAEHGVPALGYVVAYDKLHAHVSAICGASRIDGVVSAIDEFGDFARVTTSAGLFEARLVVLSDGGQLSAGKSESYDQVATIAQIAVKTPHAGRAWERFTPCGPFALLPFGKDYALVWCTSPEFAERLENKNEADFIKAAQQVFGHRAGVFRAVSKRSRFPLSLRRATGLPRRCVAVGNAAQTLHPVAGQGLNLGLRDGSELAQFIHKASPEDLGTAAFVERYLASRNVDRNATVGVTDLLVRFFSNSRPLTGLVRGSGLFLLDILPQPRRFLARRMMYGMRAIP